MELADRLSAIQEKAADPHGLSDAEAKELFISALYEGKTRGEAGRYAGRTSSWFRRRCNPEGSNYDPVFAERCERATAQNREQIVDDVFTAMVKAAKDGNVRAQEKVLAAFSEEFAFMRPQISQGDWNIDKLNVILPNVSTEVLLAMREELVKAQQAQLPVIDA